MEAGSGTRQPGLAGFLTFLSLLCSALLACPYDCDGDNADWVRRKHYEVFAVLHTLAGAAALVFAHLHHPTLWHGTAFSLGLWGIALLVSLFLRVAYGGARRAAVAVHGDGAVVYDAAGVPRRERGSPAVEEILSPRGGVAVTAFEVKVRSSDHSICYDPFFLPRLDAIGPLQHVMLCVPRVSDFQWHPLMITSRPLHSEADGGDPFRGEATTTFTLHVRSDEAKRKAWASQLAQLVRDAQAHNEQQREEEQPRYRDIGPIRILGPHGRPRIDVRRYEHVLLVGGGAGGAPLMGVLDYLLDRQWGDPELGPSRCRVVTLVWAAQRAALFDAFARRGGARGDPLGPRPGVLRVALDLDSAVPPGAAQPPREERLNANFTLPRSCTRRAPSSHALKS